MLLIEIPFFAIGVICFLLWPFLGTRRVMRFGGFLFRITGMCMVIFIGYMVFQTVKQNVDSTHKNSSVSSYNTESKPIEEPHYNRLALDRKCDNGDRKACAILDNEDQQNIRQSEETFNGN